MWRVTIKGLLAKKLRLVLTSIALLTLDFRDSDIVQSARRVAGTVFSPLRGAAETVSEPFSNAWHGITGYGDLEDETVVDAVPTIGYIHRGLEAMVERVEEEGDWPHPYLHDAGQEVARSWGAEKTPHVFVTAIEAVKDAPAVVAKVKEDIILIRDLRAAKKKKVESTLGASRSATSTPATAIVACPVHPWIQYVQAARNPANRPNASSA